MPIYGKNLKKLFLQNGETFRAEAWYLALRTQDLPSFVQMMILG